jgi:hypothetical protein
MHFTLPNMDSYKMAIEFSECSNALYDLAGTDIRIVESDLMLEGIYGSSAKVAFTVLCSTLSIFSFCFILIARLWKSPREEE